MPLLLILMMNYSFFYQRIYFIIVFITWLNIVSAQPVLQFHFDGQTGDETTLESVNNQEFDIINHFDNPERIAGVMGNALRFDGFSTWIYEPSYNLQGLTDKMSIEVWYTTEAFTAEHAGLIQYRGAFDGFSLEVSSFGEIFFSFRADNTNFTVASGSAKVEKYAWNHIAITVDLTANKAKIYLNGTEASSLTLPNLNSLTLTSSPLYIGRRSENLNFDGFPLVVSNGAIDELTIYQDVLSASQIQTNYSAFSNLSPDLTIDSEIRHGDDYLRPKYHPMPNTAWTNEPYGLTYYDGKYHLFFQKNPNGPYLYFMHWGHLSSPDLVNWTEEKIVLAPSESYDNFGVWSGTTIKDDNGVPVIFYTGVDGFKATIASASTTDNDLINWEKWLNNPQLQQPPAIPNLDFRDPYIWQEGNMWYMIVGSGLASSGGGILFTYRSPDLDAWFNIPAIFQNPDVSQTGIFWEMPYCFPFDGGNYLLGIGPVPNAGIPAEAYYYIGDFVNEEFIPHINEPKTIELMGRNFLAPAWGIDEYNEHAYIGIIPEDRSISDQVAAGWRQVFSLPRQARILNDEQNLGHIPHPNLCRLRSQNSNIQNLTLTPGMMDNLSGIEGNQIELLYKIKVEPNTNFFLDVYKNDTGTEYTRIGFLIAQNQISLDRRFSSPYNTLEDNRFADFNFNINDTLTVNIFLDHSIVEVFVNQLVVFSARVYPAQASQNVDMFVAQGQAELVQLDFWEMKSIGDPTINNDVCIPINLPDTLVDVSEVYNPLHQLKVHPNPAQDWLYLQNLPEAGKLSYEIINVKGQIINTGKLGSHSEKIKIKNLPKGTYILNVTQEQNNKSFKFIKPL